MNIGHLETILVRRPHSPLFARMADEYLLGGKIREAKELCLSGLQNHPSYATAHTVLARCYFVERNYDAAIEEATLASAYYPDSGVLQDFIRHCEEEKQHPTQAEPEPDPPLQYFSTHLQEPDLDVITEMTSSVEETEKFIFPDFHEEASPVKQIEESTDTPIIGQLPDVPGLETSSEDEESPKVIADESAMIPVSSNAAPLTQPDLRNLNLNLNIMDNSISSEQEITTVENPGADLSPVAAPGSLLDLIEHTDEEAEIAGETTAENIFESQEIPEPEEELTEEMVAGRIVSQTLAEIYTRQGAYDEAILTYKLLKRRRPEQAAEYDSWIRELKEKLRKRSEEAQ
ncbi:MAG: tetratricopeptide repeat protein [Bacteroidota bacterium]